LKDLITGQYYDPTGGIKDIKAKRIRFTTAAREKITAGKDPAELLRAFRFMAQLGWNFAPDTEEAIKSYSQKTGGKIKIQLKAALGPANWKKLINGKYKQKALAELEKYGFIDRAKTSFPDDFQ
jgi:tRNA nucleotidyltransferase/poly(A) polymerase